ncbi:ABC transporter ATP-binding protein [Sutcliffiella rhizosphaerae]|uniref:Multidrug export ATP-binding/permease protein n=1 Tax=Sutcliffiella rhizosphaerae TaxID=2880967 RepID=A0ABN8ACY4_9BACI|nr:ABC transporter ATP-binding protein [Sutcliffiella rhizosphaerae]CAG9621307.1 Putative multidrug export ATP-binding/permease protein [Sutcliffiella rhizosphaerae]
MNFPIKKFLSYYKPYYRMFFFILSCALVSSLLTLVFPLLVRYVTSDVLEGDLSVALHTSLWVGVWMILLMLFQNITNFFVDYKGHELGARMESDMRSELFSHLQKLSFSFYDRQKTGQLMTRVTNDLLMVSELYHHGPEDYVKYFIRFFGAFIILLFINVPLTLAVFCFFPILGFFSLFFNKKLNQALLQNKERIADINAQVEDALSGIRVVQSFSNEAIEMEKFNRENMRFLESRKRTYLAESYFFNGIGAFTQLITITIVIFGTIQIVNISMDLPDLITFLLYSTFMIEPIQRLTHMSLQFQEGVTGFQRFIEIMKQKPAIQNDVNAKKLSNLTGQIRFKEVSFCYSTSANPVFEHLTLDIRPGEYVAIVGPSGAGKTTLCSLIPRFYDVNEGGIYLDNENVKNLDLTFLRNSIGVVQQDIYLFSGTIMENIRYGLPHATNQEVIEAAKRANAHDFIMELPNGYDSEIGQRGVRLSGGQKQRLSIARVFLKNPPILIFDEATSSLDNESESIVKDSLELLSKGRTTIVIAHRLSTIKNAERILVLQDRGIIEQGTHETLLKREGPYSRLYARQLDYQL